MAKVEISENRLRSLLAAEAFCQALRKDVCDYGGMTKRCWPWFDQWMRRTGKVKYETPKPVHPTWCCDCRGYHVSGEHIPEVADRLAKLP